MSGVPVISIEQMRQWEQATWSTGVKESDVIEKVGRALAQRLLQLTKPGDGTLLLAGRGHNGDDTRAAKPHLADRNIILIDVSDPLKALPEFAAAIKTRPKWIVDGLFGIGL